MKVKKIEYNHGRIKAVSYKVYYKDAGNKTGKVQIQLQKDSGA